MVPICIAQSGARDEKAVATHAHPIQCEQIIHRMQQAEPPRAIRSSPHKRDRESQDRQPEQAEHKTEPTPPQPVSLSLSPSTAASDSQSQTAAADAAIAAGPPIARSARHRSSHANKRARKDSVQHQRRFLDSIATLSSQLDGDDADDTKQHGEEAEPEAEAAAEQQRPTNESQSSNEAHADAAMMQLEHEEELPPLESPADVAFADHSTADASSAAAASAAASVSEIAAVPVLSAVAPAAPIPDATATAAASMSDDMPPLSRAHSLEFPPKDHAASSSALSHSVPSTPHKPPQSESTAASAASTPFAQLFEHMQILFVPGPELTAKRIQLLTLQVTRCAGRVVTMPASSAPGSGSGLSFLGSGAGSGASASSRPKPPRPTHVLFGGMNGDYDGRVAEVAEMMSVRTRSSAVFASVEWLCACLNKKRMVDLDPFRLGAAPAASAGMTRANSIAAGNGAISPIQPVPLAKRDIRYVMDTMDAQKKAAAAAASQQQLLDAASIQPYSQQPRSSSLPRDPHHLGSSLHASSRLPLSPLIEGSEEQSAVKREEGSSAAAAAAGRHGVGKHSPKRLNLTAPLPEDATTAALSLLASTYTQAVPSFTQTVPYDASRYLPLKEHGSYLNPDAVAPQSASWNLQRQGRNEPETAVVPSRAAPSLASFHPHPKAAQAGAWIDRNKSHLACQIFSSQHKNLNGHITSHLEQLESMNDAIGDKWRTYAYRKAVGIFKKLPTAIRTTADLDALRAQSIRGLGSKILDKVSEILSTGSLQKIAAMKSNDMITTMELFGKIHGVGASTAKQWYTWGLRTIEELKTDPRVVLNASQKVGLQFMKDKAVRIPRLEVQSILEYVRRIAERILPGITVICCGSFRRGAPTSGDVDLLFTHESFTTREMAGGAEDPDSVRQREGFLRKLLKVLHEPIVPGSAREAEERAWAIDKYQSLKEEQVRIKKELAAQQGGSADTPSPPAPVPATAAAASSSSASAASSSAASAPVARAFITGDLSTFEKLSSRHGSAYWMGFCSLPDFHPFHSGWNRRMDLKVYPASHFPFALLYFTGSDHFNRSMRFYAKKKLWTLSDHGLAPAIRVNGDKVWSGRSVYCQTEKDIFAALGLDWVPPEQRNVYQHFDLTEEEIRIIQHQTQRESKQHGEGAAAAAAAGGAAADSNGSMQTDEVEESHPALRPIAASSSPAASSSAAAAAASLPPHPLKAEVKLELSEYEQVLRARQQMARIHAEEAAILDQQLLALDPAWRAMQKNKEL